MRNFTLLILLFLISCVATSPGNEAKYFYRGEVARMEMKGIAALVINGDNLSIGFNPPGHNGIIWKYKIVKRSGGKKQILKLVDSKGHKAWIEITPMWVRLSNKDGVFVFRVTFDQVKGS